jgi:Uma2 family endonuclease
MTTQTIAYVTPDEYLEAERSSESRSEYLDGVVCPMTGATANHIQIVGNLTVELGTQLRARDCRFYPVDMKVRLPGSGKFFYPDFSVVCGEVQFHDERRDIILNPVLIIEVLSKSTEAFDRGAKFLAYQTIESLKEYALVAQDKPVVEQFVRNEGGTWTYSLTSGPESSLTLPSVECTLSLSAVYSKVDFDS